MTHTRFPTKPPAPLPRPAQIGPADWNALFSAVTSRLRLTVGEQLLDNTDAALHGVACRIQTDVLDCVRALEQLRSECAAAMAQGQQQVRPHASRDELTALPNRHFFRERLGRALTPAPSQKAPPAVLYLDLDGFKSINETHGHDIGDELLRIMAMRLSRTMRSEDVVSRLGGDEFACLLADAVSREQLSFVACKLFDAVSAPLKISGLQLTVRPSIGIAMSPGDGATAGALLRSAGTAMLHAKQQHCGYAFFDSCATK